jgi:hypothetical protein
MIKFGRYPDKTVPELGAEAALEALKDAGVTIKDVEMFGQPVPVQRDGRAAHPATDRPDRDAGDQRRQCLRDRLDRLS